MALSQIQLTYKTSLYKYLKAQCYYAIFYTEKPSFPIFVRVKCCGNDEISFS